jgi:hypothetical protein
VFVFAIKPPLGQSESAGGKVKETPIHSGDAFLAAFIQSAFP